jgi:hypothetical protein
MQTHLAKEFRNDRSEGRMMATIIEVRKQEYQIRYNGHTLRQHYFTKESANKAAQQLRS